MQILSRNPYFKEIKKKISAPGVELVGLLCSKTETLTTMPLNRNTCNGRTDGRTHARTHGRTDGRRQVQVRYSPPDQL